MSTCALCRKPIRTDGRTINGAAYHAGCADRKARHNVRPMELRVGDRFTDRRGVWEIVSRPYATAGGKSVHVTAQRVGEPAVTEERTWPAYERVAVRRR